MSIHEFDKQLFGEFVEKLKAAGIITGAETDSEPSAEPPCS
jgi:hypothetical protein